MKTFSIHPMVDLCDTVEKFCSVNWMIYEELDKLPDGILQKKKLSEYGVTSEDLEAFTDTVITSQQRLMANSYVPLDRQTVRNIYQKLF